MNPVIYLPNMKSVNLPVYEIIVIEFWGGAKFNLGEGETIEGRGWNRSKEG